MKGLMTQLQRNKQKFKRTEVVFNDEKQVRLERMAEQKKVERIEAVKEAWTPDKRKKMSKKMKKKWQDPAHREKMSKAMNKLRQDPKYRELIAKKYRERGFVAQKDIFAMFDAAWEKHQSKHPDACISDERLVRSLRLKWYDQLMETTGMTRNALSCRAGEWYKVAKDNPKYRRDQ